MKKLIYTTFPIIIIIGVLGYILNIQYGNIITQQTVTYGSYTWTYYKFETFHYLDNLQDSNNLIGLITLPEIPQFKALETWDILNILKFLVNTLLIYLTNWIIYIIDIVVFIPYKALMQPIWTIMSLIGIDLNAENPTGQANTIEILTYLYKTQIPYIPYI